MSGEKKSSRGLYLFISAIAFIALGIAVIYFRNPIADMVNNIFKWIAAGILGVIAIVNIVAFAKNMKDCFPARQEDTVHFPIYDR